MKLFVREPRQEEYHQQSHNYPFVPAEIKPGDTLYSLRADYYVDRVEYGKSDSTVYATKTQVFTKRN